LCDARLGVTRWVKPSFVSCHTGVRKPDAQAYLGACAALGVEPAQALFVDDREPNVSAARALGMDTLLFDGNVAALRRALAERGLIG
jgi:putative hydrolase of the HAD superfamily